MFKSINICLMHQSLLVQAPAVKCIWDFMLKEQEMNKHI